MTVLADAREHPLTRWPADARLEDEEISAEEEEAAVQEAREERALAST